MTEQLIDYDELLIGYNKHLATKAKLVISNKRYRQSEKGKQKSYEMHKNWFDNIKHDEEYKKKQNALAKVRYHKRKAEKLVKLEKLEKLELAEKEKLLQKIDLV